MSGCKRPPQSDRPSITYRWNQVEEASFDLTDFVPEQNSSTHSQKKKQSSINTELKHPEILSTTELISAAGQLWSLINPLPTSKSEAKPNYTGTGSQRSIIFGDLVREDGGAALKDVDSRYSGVDARTASNIKPSLQPKFEFLTVTQKLSVFEPCRRNCNPLFSQFSKGNTKLSNEYWVRKRLANVACSYEVETIYGWMKEIIPGESQYPVNITKIEEENLNKICSSGNTFNNADGYISMDATHTAINFALRNADCCTDSVKSKDTTLGDNMEVEMETGAVRSLCSDYFLGSLHDNNVHNSVSKMPTSSLYVDYHLQILAPQNNTYGEFKHHTNDNQMAETRKQPREFVYGDKNVMEVCPSACARPHYALAKQEHAYAGAFAGIFVSLCLHPVDTIKTVTQSCRSEQKSICDIGRLIVSERGKFNMTILLLVLGSSP